MDSFTSPKIQTSPENDLAPPMDISNSSSLAMTASDSGDSNQRREAVGTICATLEPFEPSAVRMRSGPTPLSGLPETSASRDNTNEGSWTTVHRRTAARRKRDERRIRQLEVYNSLFHNPEPYFDRFYLIKFPVQNISTDLNVIKAESDIRAAIGNPRKVLKANRNSLLLETSNKSQSDKMLAVRSLAGMPVVVSSFSKLNTERGIVRSKAMGQCTIDELLDCLSDQNVIDIQRMKTRKDGELVEIDTYILTFKATTLPKMIKLSAWHTELVDEYIDRPRQCFKCQKFGHVAKYCRQDLDTCGNCGESGHKRESCSSDTKCFHCHEGHRSSDKRCPKYILECEILRTQHKEKTSRLIATDLVLSRHPESVHLFDSAPLAARSTPTNTDPRSYSDATRPVRAAVGGQVRTRSPPPVPPASTASSTEASTKSAKSHVGSGLKTVLASVTVHDIPRKSEKAKTNSVVASVSAKPPPHSASVKATHSSAVKARDEAVTPSDKPSVLPSSAAQLNSPKPHTYTFKRLPENSPSKIKHSDSSHTKRKISPSKDSGHRQNPPHADPAPAKKRHTSSKSESQSTNKIPVLGT